MIEIGNLPFQMQMQRFWWRKIVLLSQKNKWSVLNGAWLKGEQYSFSLFQISFQVKTNFYLECIIFARNVKHTIAYVVTFINVISFCYVTIQLY